MELREGKVLAFLHQHCLPFSLSFGGMLMTLALMLMSWGAQANAQVVVTGQTLMKISDIFTFMFFW